MVRCYTRKMIEDVGERDRYKEEEVKEEMKAEKYWIKKRKRIK